MIKILKIPPKPPSLDSGKLKLSEVVFQHQSPRQLSIITPQTYSQIEEYRGENMDKEDLAIYLRDRVKVEDNYHNLIETSEDKSFTYASIVGFNKMESVLDYPGFTYYFNIKPKQLEETIFELVAGKNKEYDLRPQVGFDGLENCLKHWVLNSAHFKPYEDDILGFIDPRIEVVIGYDITPFAMIPEIEQR
jgi:hypothetical protein